MLIENQRTYNCMDNDIKATLKFRSRVAAGRRISSNRTSNDERAMDIPILACVYIKPGHSPLILQFKKVNPQ